MNKLLCFFRFHKYEIVFKDFEEDPDKEYFYPSSMFHVDRIPVGIIYRRCLWCEKRDSQLCFINRDKTEKEIWIEEGVLPDE